jgi:hypothetical protein
VWEGGPGVGRGGGEGGKLIYLTWEQLCIIKSGFHFGKLLERCLRMLQW